MAVDGKFLNLVFFSELKRIKKPRMVLLGLTNSTTLKYEKTNIELKASEFKQ